MNRELNIFILLTMIFTAVIIISNVIANKVVQVWWWVTPAAVFAYPFTFTVTDVISEIYGKQRAKQVVWYGFVANLFLVVLIQLAIHLPPAPFYQHNQEFALVLGGTWRIVLASMVAYLMSQSHDVWAFHFWKRKTNARFLWLRNNASTMVSQLIDTVIFIGIAFAGLVPSAVLWKMMLSQYSLKLIIALLDTPIVYVVVKLITGQWTVKNEWTFETETG